MLAIGDLKLLKVRSKYIDNVRFTQKKLICLLTLHRDDRPLYYVESSLCYDVLFMCLIVRNMIQFWKYVLPYVKNNQ